jgi:hypothetical protein
MIGYSLIIYKQTQLSTKQSGTFIKNKNYRKLSQKLTKITFFTTKITDPSARRAPHPNLGEEFINQNFNVVNN